MDKIKKVLTDLIYAVKNGLMHILTGNILVRMIGFISSIVVIRLVNKADYAYLSYADNLYSYITMMSGFGLYTALIKFCSKNEDKKKDKAYLKFAAGSGIILHIFAALIIVLLSYILEIPFKEARFFILALTLEPALHYLVLLFQSYNRAHLDYKAYSRIAVIQSLFAFLFSYVCVYIMNVDGYVVARYLTTVFTILYCMHTIKDKIERKQENVKLSFAEKKEFLLLGGSLVIATFFSSIMPVNEVFLVNNLIKDEIVTANFRIAGIIPQQILFITSAFTIYIFPIFAKMTDKKEIWKNAVKYGVINGLIIIFVAVIGMLFTPFIITFAYGDKYADAVNISYYLWIMRSLNAGFRMIPLNILPAIGKHKFNAVMAVCSTPIHIIIDYYFIKTYGVIGAAFATIIIYLITGTILWVYLYYMYKKEKKI